MRSVQVNRPRLEELGARFVLDQNRSNRFECFLAEPLDEAGDDGAAKEKTAKGTAKAKAKEPRSRATSPWQAFLHARTLGKQWQRGQMQVLKQEYERLTDDERKLYVQMAVVATAAHQRGLPRYSDSAVLEREDREELPCPESLEVVLYPGVGPDVQEFNQELLADCQAIRLSRQQAMATDAQQLAAYAAAPVNLEEACASDLMAHDDMLRSSVGPATRDLVMHLPVHLPADVFAEAHGLLIDTQLHRHRDSIA